MPKVAKVHSRRARVDPIATRGEPNASRPSTRPTRPSANAVEPIAEEGSLPAIPLERDSSISSSEGEQDSLNSSEEDDLDLDEEDDFDSEEDDHAAHLATPRIDDIRQELGGPKDVGSYLILVRLSYIKAPTIHRLLCVPSNLTFGKFHEVLQVAFGWTNSHLHRFNVIKLKDKSEPRNIDLWCPTNDILTLCPPDPYWDDDMMEMNKNENEYTLADIYDNDEYRHGVEMTYIYDFGDNWEHEIQFLGKADPAMKRSLGIREGVRVVCISGEGHHAAEDCGGSECWKELKREFKRKGDPEGRKHWYKNACGNGDRKGLDPYKFEILDVNRGFAKFNVAARTRTT